MENSQKNLKQINSFDEQVQGFYMSNLMCVNAPASR